MNTHRVNDYGVWTMSVKEAIEKTLIKLNKELEIAQETENLEKVASLTFLISEYEVMLEEDEVRQGRSSGEHGVRVQPPRFRVHPGSFLHGAHHVAQKSTKTTLFLFKTSSKFESKISTAFPILNFK